MNPTLSLVTGKLGRDASFQRLVGSIVEHTDVEWELVCADASPVPYEPALPNIRVIHENPRVSCVAGYNAAFGAAKGEWVIFLNDDAEVMPKYASEAIAFMEANPQIGLGALLYSENGGPWHWNQAWGCGYSNFGILKRTLGERVGWFGNLVKMYGCDNILTLEVLMAGYGVAAIPTARVLHHSVQDETRKNNQRDRLRDNEILTKTYMPMKSLWLSTYNRYRIWNEIPWVHGVNPELVNQ